MILIFINFDISLWIFICHFMLVKSDFSLWKCIQHVGQVLYASHQPFV